MSKTQQEHQLQPQPEVIVNESIDPSLEINPEVVAGAKQSLKKKTLKTILLLTLGLVTVTLLRFTAAKIFSGSGDNSSFSGFSGLALGLVIIDLINIVLAVAFSFFLWQALKIWKPQRAFLTALTSMILFIFVIETAVATLPEAKGWFFTELYIGSFVISVSLAILVNRAQTRKRLIINYIFLIITFTILYFSMVYINQVHYEEAEQQDNAQRVADLPIDVYEPAGYEAYLYIYDDPDRPYVQYNLDSKQDAFENLQFELQKYNADKLKEYISIPDKCELDAARTYFSYQPSDIKRAPNSCIRHVTPGKLVYYEQNVPPFYAQSYPRYFFIRKNDTIIYFSFLLVAGKRQTYTKAMADELEKMLDSLQLVKKEELIQRVSLRRSKIN